MRIRLSSSRGKEAGFTLVEMAVGLAVGMFLLVTTTQFLSHTVGVVTKLNVQRDIRDQGMMAVETIERGFRAALEYGGVFTLPSGLEIVAKDKALNPTHTVTIKMITAQNAIELNIDGEVNRFPNSSGLLARNFSYDCIEKDGKTKVIVVSFELGDGGRDIWRAFKAAFSTALAKQS